MWSVPTHRWIVRSVQTKFRNREVRQVLDVYGETAGGFDRRRKGGSMELMPDWRRRLNDDPLPWLLELDPENPGVRYFALRDLLDCSEEDPEVEAARSAIMATGPVPAILDAQYPEGYWVKPGGGYSPKYRSTVWQILLLAELGADPADERVRRGCEYLLTHSVASNGAFSARQKPVPSVCVHCLNGNMIGALLRLAMPAMRACRWHSTG